MKIALMTTNRVDLIDQEDFIKQMLEESVSAYDFNIIMIKKLLSLSIFFSNCSNFSFDFRDGHTH